MPTPFDTPQSLPDFDSQFVTQQDGGFSKTTISLATFQKVTDKGLILYFYPKDSTTGCTTQAQEFSEYLSEFHTLGYEVIGVSRDSTDSHQRFIGNKALKISLISDVDEQLCQYFGVIGEKMMYGKKVQGVVRSTFIFDAQGKLQHEYRNVRANGHVKKLLLDLQNNFQKNR